MSVTDSDPEYDETRHAPTISVDTNYLTPSYSRSSAPPAYGADLGQSPKRLNALRRLSIRPVVPARQSRTRRSFSSSVPGQPAVQLISLPQIDAIQRSLKLLDVRLQHVQSSAREEDHTRQDIEHIRRVMSENQKALATVVTVLSSIQEEVRSLSVAVHRQQATTFHIQPHSRRKSNEVTTGGGMGTGAGGGGGGGGAKEIKNGKDVPREASTNLACKMEVSLV